jgi:UDP-glucose 4-epimerase
VPFITQTAAGIREKLIVHGSDYSTPDGSCVRDYIHVVDLARAHVLALDWMEQQEAPLCEVFNLGTGKGNSVLEVVKTFEQVSGVKLPFEIGPRRPGDVEAIWADTSKSREELVGARGWICAKRSRMHGAGSRRSAERPLISLCRGRMHDGIGG